VYFWGTLLYLLTAGFCNARYVALVLDVIGTEGYANYMILKVV
jgi:hypothetical protein